MDKSDAIERPIITPGKIVEGTFMKAYQEIFGVTDEALAYAAAEVARKLASIAETERRARIMGRNIVIR